MILLEFTQKHCLLHSLQDLCWHSGWPLAVGGALVLHLGALDESLVRVQDCYLCIRPEPETHQPCLYAVWRGGGTPSSDQYRESTTDPPAPIQPSPVVYRQLDPIVDPITPLAVEMLAEDLPALLQNLLVGIERAICRVPLEELSFPTQECASSATTTSEEADDRQNNNGCIPSEPSDRQDKYILAPGTPKIGLKRRELITKNKLVNNKYALKRIASTTTPPNTSHQNGNNHNNTNGNSFINRHESVTGKSEITSRINGNQCNDGLATPTAGTGTEKEDDGSAKLCDTGGTTSTATAGIVGGGRSDNHQSSTSAATPTGAADINSMPLFCLGGSFPHIDSDEESGDDMKRCETGESIVCP